MGRSLFDGGKITVPARSENGDAQEACAGEHAIEIKAFQNFLEILEVRWESQGRGRKRPRLFCVLLISGKMVLPYFFVQHSQEGGIFSVSRSGSRNRQCQDLGPLLQAVNIHGLRAPSRPGRPWRRLQAPLPRRYSRNRSLPRRGFPQCLPRSWPPVP